MCVCMHVSVYVCCTWLAKFLFVFIFFFMHETWFLELVVDLEVYNPIPTARFAAQLWKVSSPESFFSEAVFSRAALVSQQTLISPAVFIKPATTSASGVPSHVSPDI